MNKGNILMIAPTERQAYSLFDKTLSYLLENHRNHIKRGKDRPTKSKITLKNGVKIYCLPTGISGLGIRGMTVARLYADEASRIPEEVWDAVTPMLLTTGGDSILLSTPYGAVGEFYRCFINDDSNYNSYTRFSIDSEKVMRERPISDSWTELIREKALNKLEQEKGRMSKRAYAQEYMGQFIEDLTRYFSDELIKKCCVLKRLDNISKKKYYLGCDIARMGEDEGTFEILERDDDKLYQRENIITRKKLTTETEDKILALNRIWDFKRIYLDAGSGSLGVGIFDHLLREPEVSRKIEAINNAVRQYDRHSKTTTKLLKEDLYDHIRSLMEKGLIQFLDDDEVIESFRSVQYEYNQRAGRPTTLKIFGNYTHVVEGLIRAAWCTKDKSLNIWIRSIKV